MLMIDEEALIAKVNSITNVHKQTELLYSIMDELGLKYKRTRCFKCHIDYLNIVKEELGLIEDASEQSKF